MFYKNISLSVKTFHGVEFKPGDVNEVTDYINDDHMIRVEKPAEPPKPHKKSEQVTDNKNTSTKTEKPITKEDTCNGTDNH